MASGGSPPPSGGGGEGQGGPGITVIIGKARNLQAANTLVNTRTSSGAEGGSMGFTVSAVEESDSNNAPSADHTGHVGSGLTTSSPRLLKPSPSSGGDNDGDSPSVTVSAGRVRNLQTAHTLINIQPVDWRRPDQRGRPIASGGIPRLPEPSPSSGRGQIRRRSPSRLTLMDQGNDGEDCRFYCMLDTESVNDRPCRFVQTDTNPLLWVGNPGDLTVSNYQFDVSYCLNTETVQKLLDENCNPESVQESLGQCLASLKWSPQAIFQQKFAAFKLTLCEEKIPRLLQTVLDLVTQHYSDKSELVGLVSQAFKDFGAQLKLIVLGSLTFVFQFPDKARADEMLGSDDVQGELIGVLHQFLPEWVRLHARWEVQRWAEADCRPASTGGTEPVSVWRMFFGPPGPVEYHGPTQTPEEVALVKVERLMRLMEERVGGRIDQAIALIQASLHQPPSRGLRQETSRDQEEQSLQFSPPPPSSRQLPASPLEEVLASAMTDPKTLYSINPTHPDLQAMPYRPSPKSSAMASSILSPSVVEYTGSQEVAFPEIGGGNEGISFGSVRFSKEQSEGVCVSVDPKEAAAVVSQQEHRGSSGHGSHRTSRATESPDIAVAEMGLAEVYSATGGIDDQDSHYPRESQKFVNVSSHSQNETRGAEGGGRGSSAPEPQLVVEREEVTAHEEASVRAFRGGREAESEAAVAASKRPSKAAQAEQLLKWVNVKTGAGRSTDPNILVLMQQVELALQEDDVPCPVAKSMDTVLVLDTSDSVAQHHLDELKAAALTFVDGIEENVEAMNMEENLAVIQMGGRAWVRQHLTNDYNRIREVIDVMGPDSPVMPTGGRTPLFQTLLVCLGAIDGRGGVLNVAGHHRVRPRLIIFTDGRPTSEFDESGPDTQSNVNEVKFSLVQLITEFASKRHKTTPMPISWVPIGDNIDMTFLGSLAKMSGGQVVDKDNVVELCRYFIVQEAIGCVFQVVHKNRDVFDEEEKILPVISALAGSLGEAEKNFVLKRVVGKLREPEEVSDDPRSYNNVFEDTELVMAGLLLPLGTRVVRGPDWKWGEQDTEGPGTVLQHRRKRDSHLYVMWDNGTHNVYRYGFKDYYDVICAQDSPRIVDGPEYIKIGVEVTRGVDWSHGSEDERGTGVVIRTHRSGKVKVRWPSAYIGKYIMTADKQQLQLVRSSGQPRESQSDMVCVVADEELGAVGGFDPRTQPPPIPRIPLPEPEIGRRVWQWWDRENSRFRMYPHDVQEKLLKAYRHRSTGSCVLHRDGVYRRLIFKKDEEKTLDTNRVIRVSSRLVEDNQYLEMMEEERAFRRQQGEDFDVGEHQPPPSTTTHDVDVDAEWTTAPEDRVAELAGSLETEGLPAGSSEGQGEAALGAGVDLVADVDPIPYLEDPRTPAAPPFDAGSREAREPREDDGHAPPARVGEGDQ